MTQMEKEGFVFQFLRNVPGDVLCPSLPVDPELILRLIRDQEPIDEFHLVKALQIFETDRDVYDFLCTLEILNT